MTLISRWCQSYKPKDYCIFT